MILLSLRHPVYLSGFILQDLSEGSWMSTNSPGSFSTPLAEMMSLHNAWWFCFENERLAQISTQQMQGNCWVNIIKRWSIDGAFFLLSKQM